MSHRKTSQIILLAWAFFTCLSVSGQESDLDQPIIYTSQGGSTSRTENGVRTVTLENQVTITQGSLELTGDQAVYESDAESGTIQLITVTGAPAHYRQASDETGEMIEGDSDSIHYYVEGDEAVVEFIGSATLTRTNDILSCASIKYYTDSRFTETTGPWRGRVEQGRQLVNLWPNKQSMDTLQASHLAKSYKGRQVVPRCLDSSQSRRSRGLTGTEWSRQDNLFLHDRRFNSGRRRQRDD